jgi:hypothetical protein
MCLRRRRLYLAVLHPRRQIVVGPEPQLVVVAGHMASVLHCRIATVAVSVACAAGLAAAEACQGVLVGPQCWGGGCDWDRHMVMIVAVAAEEQADVVQVCFQAVGSVVAASGLGAVRTEVVPRLVVADSVVAAADAREEKLEVVGMIVLPVAAQSTVVDLVVAGLARVSAELCILELERGAPRRTTYHIHLSQVVLVLVSSALHVFSPCNSRG